MIFYNEVMVEIWHTTLQLLCFCYSETWYWWLYEEIMMRHYGKLPSVSPPHISSCKWNQYLFWIAEQGHTLFFLLLLWTYPYVMTQEIMFATVVFTLTVTEQTNFLRTKYHRSNTTESKSTALSHIWLQEFKKV